jgi:NAD(P)-dependent dehydrogenase (short-subunit alcohol dehydrogenase family)
VTAKPTILIAGASRGIGLTLVGQFAQRGWRVLGTARDISAGAAISKAGGEVHLCDVADPASVARLGTSLAQESLDVLLCNAGIYGPRDWAVGKTDYAAWEQVMKVNVFGPMRLVEALLEPVARSTRKTIVATSSRMGSIGLHSGGAPIYRSSKAALNLLVKGWAVDLAPRGITAVTYHPGWVQTDMGGASATLTVAESTAAIAKLIDGLTPKDNGKFFNYDGAELEW